MKNIAKILLIMCMFLMVGCNNNQNTDAPQNEPNNSTQANAQGNRIEPYESTINLDNLEDCILHVGFDESNLQPNADGVLEVEATVYDYELFDMVDINQLKEGDTLVIDKNDMVVNKIEKTDDGRIIINDGLYEGGCDLTTDGDTVYHETLSDDAYSFYEVGNITLPLSDNFVFINQRDLVDQAVVDGKEKRMNLDDFYASIRHQDVVYSPQELTARIEDGKIVEMTQIFMP